MLSVDINENGSLRRLNFGDIAVNLYPGSEMEGGCANVYLRCGVNADGSAVEHIALLGPRSLTRFSEVSRDQGLTRVSLMGTGVWHDLHYRIALVLSADSPAWFWHVSIENTGRRAQDLDLILAQDIALAPYAAVRINEFYVSQYVDHTALVHGTRGVVVASRQNQRVDGRCPWSIIGSLRRGSAFATDALQFYALAARSGAAPVALLHGLPSRRRQHEHSMVAIQDERLRLDAGERVDAGFFGGVMADHPAATSAIDLAAVDAVLALPEASAHAASGLRQKVFQQPARSLFSAAPLLQAQELTNAELVAIFGAERAHEELDEHGKLLAFFYGADRHVVLRAKERRVLRPHGHLLRTGNRLTPDERALTSTTWMGGVFNSMVTQGHVNFNRLLSTVRGYLGLFRAHGQRVFVELDNQWHLLDLPSAFEMTPGACRWIYRHAAGTIEVRSHIPSQTLNNPHELALDIRIGSGEATRFLISHHIALDGDDGNATGPVRWSQTADGIALAPAAASELGQRFAGGDFLISAAAGTHFERLGGDELLFSDGRSRQQPYFCVITAPAVSVGLKLRGRLIVESHGDSPAVDWREEVLSLALRVTPLAGSVLADAAARIERIVPWFRHNALIHYLAPRGLEQYTGGGWGTRDVCQGPVELLLACGSTAAVRDLLLRVFGAQNPDGDWPQWFMFFTAQRHIRANDSHGDVVFWPVLALAQYLIASADATLLEERVSFFAATSAGESATVGQHLQRALSLIERRLIAGTALAAYGHGDWNDSLQPADPAMREQMCSVWTVTLHYQTLTTLARALRLIGRAAEAMRLEENASAVRRDFQRLLLIDGVLPGYARFDAGKIRYLLHPRDASSGVRYSALAMIHAILEDMLDVDQARAHLALIDEHLIGPDGIRLFDRPLPYRGGPQRFFQRAESATFFGREIGLMYMHAHLRFAQALAHLGEADRFFKALCQVNPIGLKEIVPQATLRQSNCYYSSSDAAFDDRYQASEQYDRVAAGAIPLDGGWRVYSSGAGIALKLIVQHFLGLRFDADVVCVDPVIPAALNGLRVTTTLLHRPLILVYEIGVAGCGVKSVILNGKELSFQYESNPYRQGGARVDRKDFIASLAPGVNALRICLGNR